MVERVTLLVALDEEAGETPESRGVTEPNASFADVCFDQGLWEIYVPLTSTKISGLDDEFSL